MYVDKDDIKKNSDGTFTVSKAWMLKRMSLEERLTNTLRLCREEYLLCRDKEKTK